MTRNRNYYELSKLNSFEERFNYLKLDGVVGESTFGFDRYLNQTFYKSPEWKKIRRKVIIRDNGFDMGLEDYPIGGRIIIHHMNPITEEDILNRASDIMNPEYLISVSFETHNAIHYGDSSIVKSKELVIRRPNDTCPWKG